MKVSVNILTKNRAQSLKKALLSVANQSFKDLEVVVVNDGSTDETENVFKDLPTGQAGLKFKDLKIIKHTSSVGITGSRQEALLASGGEYIAVLDDDDEWTDKDKLKKQVEYLEKNKQAVLVGGGIVVGSRDKVLKTRLRAETDKEIRSTMLFRNNFFTSTVMFRTKAALEAGGFIKDDIDLAEDYDLWLRLGQKGGMYNFQEAFVNYTQSVYNKEKFKSFLTKQLRLIERNKSFYPYYFLAKIILQLRMLFNL